MDKWGDSMDHGELINESSDRRQKKFVNVREWMVLGILAATLVFTIVQALGDRFDLYDSRLDYHDARIVANEIHRVEHDKSAAHWIAEIQRNTKRIRALENNANSRADPFTGTEGKQLERRIESLEKRR